MNCWSPRKEADGVVTATGLVPGQEYMIMIDGWGGDTCEYSFAASSGIVIADAGEDKTMCEGQTVTLTASGGTGYQWSTGATTQNINVSPSVTQTYTVTVTGSNPDCPGVDDAVVFVNSTDASFSGLDPSYCADDNAPVPLTGDFPTSISDFSGNGISNDSIFTPSVAGVGTHSIAYTYEYSVVTIFSDDFDPSPASGWTHGGSNGDSWATGTPQGGNGTNLNSNSNPDPFLDHSSNINNHVYGQGLGSGTGDGVGGHFDSSNEWLLSPPIDCSELTNTVLSFWRYANFEQSWDECYVKICNEPSLTTWYNLGQTLYPQDEQWTQRIIDISQYADGKSSVYILWQSISDGAQTYSGWNIDDVSITGVQSGGSCTSTEIQTTTVYAKPTSSFTATNPACNNSNSTVTYTGSASSGATYSWNFGGGTIQSGSGQGPYQISFPASQSYTISLGVTENSCSSTVSTQQVTVPTAISLTPAQTNANCDNSDGNASVVASGGTSPYSYDWSPNGYTGDGTSTYSNLPAGTYTVTVTDSHSCTKTNTFNISNIGGPTVTTNILSNVTCYYGNNGSASVSATGGVGPYTYLWSNNATTTTINNLTANNYSVTVTGGNGCNATGSISITQPTDISVSGTATNVSCNGGNDGSIDLTVSGGTPGYAYNWNTGQISQDISGLTAGVYTVTVTDINIYPIHIHGVPVRPLKIFQNYREAIIPSQLPTIPDVQKQNRRM
ncbi:MAG: hypothetical protein HY738_07120 [Bacteroidia bacterium]|nr:hypothetical protein [Bacteroidia bacterium]